MNKILFTTALSVATLLGQAFAIEYKADKDFVRLPDINSHATDQHGDVAISSKGEIFVSTMDPDAGLQVFAADGKFLRNIPGAPNDLHGFIIRKERDGEFIYGPRLDKQSIVKMTLDGKTVMEIPGSAIPDKFKNVRPPNTKKNAKGEIPKSPDEGKPFLRMTSVAVAPNGDLYVSDGYASDYVHRFDRTGKYITSFGGKKEPYGFRTLHKIAIDTRFSPVRIIAVDRANNRVVHMDLDGKLLGVVASDMLLPAAISIRGDHVAIAELKGQVTILDKAGKVVTKFGTNSDPEEAGKNRPEPAKWKAGIVTAPHGVTYTDNGDLLVSEYNIYGRVHRFVRK
jgi:hypothetical protein